MAFSFQKFTFSIILFGLFLSTVEYIDSRVFYLRHNHTHESDNHGGEAFHRNTAIFQVDHDDEFPYAATVHKFEYGVAAAAAEAEKKSKIQEYDDEDESSQTAGRHKLLRGEVDTPPRDTKGKDDEKEEESASTTVDKSAHGALETSPRTIQGDGGDVAEKTPLNTRVYDDELAYTTVVKLTNGAAETIPRSIQGDEDDNQFAVAAGVAGPSEEGVTTSIQYRKDEDRHSFAAQEDHTAALYQDGEGSAKRSFVDLEENTSDVDGDAWHSRFAAQEENAAALYDDGDRKDRSNQLPQEGVASARKRDGDRIGRPWPAQAGHTSDRRHDEDRNNRHRFAQAGNTSARPHPQHRFAQENRTNEAAPLAALELALNWQSIDPWLNAYPEARRSQRLALATLYYATAGENWTNNQGWLSYEVHECEWFSKSTPSEVCDDDDAYTALHLTGNNLAGRIPPELYVLSALSKVDLSRNSLSGEILSTFGAFGSLAHLNLGNNNLIGSIPLELTRLTMVDRLGLHNNNLTGELPSQLGLLTQ